MHSGCGRTVLTVRPSNLRLSMLCAPLFASSVVVVEPYPTEGGAAAAVRSNLEEGQCENA